MLSRTHLAVLRAALQYFNEELGPHGLEAMQPYLDEAVEGDITAADIRQLQQFLREMEIKYVTLNALDGQPSEVTLYRTAEEAANASPERSGPVGVVLIPSKR